MKGQSSRILPKCTGCGDHLGNLRINLRKFYNFFQKYGKFGTFWQNSWTLTLHNFCVSQPIGPIEGSNERSILPLSDTYHTYRKWPENVSRRWSRNSIESDNIENLFFVQKILGLLGYSVKQTAFENIKPFQRNLNYSQKQPFYIPWYNSIIL